VSFFGISHCSLQNPFGHDDGVLNPSPRATVRQYPRIPNVSLHQEAMIISMAKDALSMILELAAKYVSIISTHLHIYTSQYIYIDSLYLHERTVARSGAEIGHMSLNSAFPVVRLFWLHLSAPQRR